MMSRLGCSRASSTAVAHRGLEADGAEQGGQLLLNTEVCVVFHEFLNIDLYSQGWYSLRVRFLSSSYSTSWPCRVVSQDAFSSLSPMGTSGTRVARNWEIEDRLKSFRSRVFQIRYCHEQVPLDEVVTFRVTTDIWAGVKGSNITMEVELLFHDVDPSNMHEPPEFLELKPVAKRSICIVSPARGVHELLPIVFDEAHLSCVKLSVHSVLLGFTSGVCRSSKVRTAPVRPQTATPEPTMRHSDFEADDSNPNPKLHSSHPAAFPHLKVPELQLEASPPMTPISLSARNALKRPDPNDLQDVVDSPYFPPFMVKDITHQAVDLQHPLTRLIGKVPEQYKDSDLGQKLQLAQGNMEKCLGLLHRVLTGTLLDSYNVLIRELQRLPASCFAPQKLETLRLVMLPGAMQLSNITWDTMDVLCMQNGRPTKTSDGTLRTSTNRSIQLPSMGFNEQVNASPLGITSSRSLITAEEIGRAGHKHSLLRAIEEGHILGYESPNAFLASLPRNCSVELATEAMLDELRQISAGILTSWGCLLWVTRHANGQLAQVSEAAWVQQRRSEWGPWIMDACQSPCISKVPVGNLSDWHNGAMDRVAEAELKSTPAGARMLTLEYNDSKTAYRQELRKVVDLSDPRLQDQSLYARPHANPVIRINASGATAPETPLSEQGRPATLAPVHTASGKPPRKVHVVVFVHGFQGMSTDLRLVRNHMQVLQPRLACLMSKSNEGKTLEGIDQMGERLADEVAEYLLQFHDAVVRRRKILWKLSFVGHSIGNLIIRAALTCPKMEMYRTYLWFLMSVSGPHLGYLFSTNRLFDGGLWVLKSCKNVKCLHQLSFTDAPRVEDCFLYKLAMQAGLSKFRHVMVCSSVQDGYVPLHSARIESCPAALKDTRKGKAYQSMLHALTSNLGNGAEQARVTHVEVDFYQQSNKRWTSMNSIVGRKAHIDFIESDLWVRFLAWTFFYERRLLDEDT